MSRAYSGVERRAVASSYPEAAIAAQSPLPYVLSPHSSMRWEFWAVRGFLIVCAAMMCYALRPFQLPAAASASLGAAIASLILLAELRLRRAATNAVLGGALGAMAGVFAAMLVTLTISRMTAPEATKSFLECAVLAACAYLGLTLGSKKGQELLLARTGEPVAVGNTATEHTPVPESLKLLDTSVLIDGRIADICEAQFLDGVLIAPQFVLHELQLVPIPAMC